MKIIPVIHYLDESLALDQVRIAREAGASGVFLISHRRDDEALINAARKAKAVHPEFSIGINLLNSSPMHAASSAYTYGLDMVWADDMGVSSAGLTGLGGKLSEMAKQKRFAHDERRIEFFASIAFKYQPNESAPCVAAKNALAAGFIPTTSGAATGSAPGVAKIASMSAASGGTLAVASGMTPENVRLYARHLSHILVSTGISVDDYRMCPARLRLLIDRCKASA